jgi:DNA polymerase I
MASPAPRLFLIDGSSYIYRAFFALPPLTGPNGLPTHAVYGFTTMVLKLLREVQPRLLGVVFDAPGATFRDQLFEAYKANRPGMPSDLVAQIPLVHEVVQALRIRSLQIPGVEADDVIGTLTARFAGERSECVVVTGDKDLMQLVGPSVRLWDTMRDRWTDEAAVQARFGISPSQVVDVMALMGDSIDNIPGVKGIGEKTATALIQRFGSVENLLDRLDEVAGSGLRNAARIAALLRAGAEAARLSRELARVRRDVPVEVTLDDFTYGGADPAALRSLFLRLGFQSLARDLTGTSPPLTVHLRSVDSAPAFAAFHATARRAGRVGLATAGGAPEGAAPDAPADVLIFQAGEEDPISVNLRAEPLREVVGELLADPALEKVGHDLKRDVLRLHPAPILREPSFDTMVASYLLDASATHRLEDLAPDILGVNLPEFRGGAEAVAAGVTVLPRLAEEMAARLRSFEMTKLFREIEMPLLYVLAAMERRGVCLDLAALAAMSRELEQRLRALMAEVYAMAGGEFNINSPPQLRTVLFERLGLSKKGVRRGKTGYSTDVDVLTRLAQEHPVPAKILEYRALSKLKSTYVDALPAAVNPATGRLHTSFNQTVAVTGRLSSSNPNLQNIPVRGEEGRRIRAAFVAEPGYVLVAADYSQIELRVLAHLSHDPALIEAFRADVDVHARTAAEIFNVLPGTITAEMRRAAKVINFGIIYGMGPQRLAHELGISPTEAQEYIGRYFERYAGVRSFLDETIAGARRRGYVTTICGRRRALPELMSNDRVVVQAAERTATNTPIQGSAADIIKMAMVALDRKLQGEELAAAMTLQVHDELVFEVAEGDVDRAQALIRAEMEAAVPLAVPLKVDIGMGRDWAAAHP